MDSTGIDYNEPCVDEGAFWHTNMDLYYGYYVGEVVEVEHEEGKYWLARIQYCYKHLLLLNWVGNYGEFWMETSQNNGLISSTRSEFNSPKRVFPLGYHFQSKSLFKLERPTTFMVPPSLYNECLDPYAHIKTVDDLLADVGDEEITKKDAALMGKSDNENLELALACNKKIEYKQEDVDELETALHNLNYVEGEESGDTSNAIKDSGIDSEPSSEKGTTDGDKSASNKGPCASQDRESSLREMQASELCRALIQEAVSQNSYSGLESLHCNTVTDEVFHLKPKQFYDMGGANHERLFVPGTLVEVCHTSENSSGNLDVSFWFAYVIKNTGGRLNLRWFLCDEPKFRQGRLELKSARSYLVHDELDQARGPEDQACGNGDKVCDESGPEPLKQETISAKSITFSLHFCDPKIYTLQHAEKNGKQYQLPKNILGCISKSPNGDEVVEKLKKEQMDHLFETRRINLDKDRPLIDHILDAAKYRSPKYLDLLCPSKDDTKSRREVLISCPKLTKLLKATVVRQLDKGVFEIHSDPIYDDDEIIKFIYPYDSCHAVLPLDWANNNEDCLSVDPSRNPTPDQQDTATKVKADQSLGPQTDATGQEQPAPGVDVKPDSSKEELGNAVSSSDMCLDFSCLMPLRKVVPKLGGPFKRVPDKIANAITKNDNDSIEENDPTRWMKALGQIELNATSFHCCIDRDLKEAVESKFKVMDQLEVRHPSSDSTICLGRIRKVVFPLIWVQISPDCFTLIPYDSTDIYPAKWCSTHGHKLVSLLPPRKRATDSDTRNSKKRKKAKTIDDARSRVVAAKIGSGGKRVNYDDDELYEKEQFNLGDIYDRQLDFDFILQEKNNYITIYFNHKCFTGPSLSKSKICSLPQYVGPGPMHLVLEEVVTKVISVAYVPPRILNDLTSKSFEELLAERKLTNTKNQTFKAKYQKRVHRERVPVCLNPSDIALYCECICEHIKCCYNLFGPKLYDGDDCPSHCRSLTKSNKFMKRATYYREKARQGDYLASETPPTGPKKGGSAVAGNDEPKIPREAGRDSESTNSSVLSRSEQVQSRASSPSSCDGDGATNDLKESLKAVVDATEIDQPTSLEQDGSITMAGDHLETKETHDASTRSRPITTYGSNGCGSTPESDCQNQPEFDILDTTHGKMGSPEDWTVGDVAQFLDSCQLSVFRSNIESEGIDGQALLLLDDDAIKEHFGSQNLDYTGDEVDKLCRFIALIKTRAEMRA